MTNASITERCRGCEWYRAEVEQEKQIGYNKLPSELKPFCVSYRLHIEWLFKIIENYDRCFKYHPKQEPIKLKIPMR